MPQLLQLYEVTLFPPQNTPEQFICKYVDYMNMTNGGITFTTESDECIITTLPFKIRVFTRSK